LVPETAVPAAHVGTGLANLNFVIAFDCVTPFAV
jgi:hypothetical protein